MAGDIKELNLRLNQTYRKQDDLYHDYASHFGLSVTGFWILYTLCETDEDYTQNKLADMWYLPRQSINSAVASLVKAGYLQLEQMALARNNKALRLTQKGELFCQKVIYPFYQLEERILRKMTDEERRQLLALSTKQYELMREEVEAAISK